MCLTLQNQLTLLHDLLQDQMIYKTYELNDYYQIRKIIQFIIGQQNIDKELSNLLTEVYYYVIKGEKAHSIPEHVNDNRDKILNWLQIIRRTKLRLTS